MDVYRSIMDNLVTAVVTLDERLCVLHINAAAEFLLHTSSMNAEGQPLREIVLRADLLLPSLNDALDNGQSYTERDVTLHLPDDIVEQVDITVSTLDLGPGGQRIVIIELQPLSRLKRINRDEASFERQETTRRLTRGLAHEIKNPLGGIRGAAQLLDRELPDADLKEYTSVIINETDRLTELVDRMLGPRQELDLQPVNLLRVLEHVMQLIDAEQPGMIRWERDYDPSLPEVEADESQLIQAVLNIVRNAVQALTDTDKPCITFRTRAARQFTIGTRLHRVIMRLDITDNGPGIDEELEGRIFFPMISGRADGSGLGLAITQNIISQHQGSIQVDSKPGRTSFTLYLPFHQPQADAGAEEAPQPIHLKEYMAK